MGLNEKYDPQDIEKLMEEKSFHELLKDERDFVLKHVESAEEYELIRETMIAVQESVATDEPPLPRPEMRRELIAAFKEERKSGLRYWLNSISALLIPNEGKAAWAPIARIATVVLLVGGAIFTYDRFGRGLEKDLVSENVTQEQKTIEENNAQQVVPFADSVKRSNANAGNGLAENNYLGETKKESSEIEEPSKRKDLVSGDLVESTPLPPIMAEEEAEMFDEIAVNEEIEAVEEEVTEFVMPAEDLLGYKDDASDGAVTTSAPAAARESIQSLSKRTSRNEAGSERSMSKSRSLSQDKELIAFLVQAF